MAQQALESTVRAEGAEGCVVLVVSTGRDFLDHYRKVFLSLGLVPITATSARAATAILNLMVVAMVVIDQRNGTQAVHKVLKRAHDLQPHALGFVIGHDPDFRLPHEAPAPEVAEYLDHPAAAQDFVHAFQLVHEGAQH
jgi:DNA-binding NtrC family response regulator